jgi:hypothetical protein
LGAEVKNSTKKLKVHRDIVVLDKKRASVKKTEALKQPKKGFQLTGISG